MLGHTEVGLGGVIDRGCEARSLDGDWGTSMTEPLSPTTPIPEPRRKRHIWRWVAAAVTVVLIIMVCAVVYAGHRIGDTRAANYAKAVEAWEAKDASIRSVAAKANEGLWNFKDTYDEYVVRELVVACENLEQLRNDIQAQAEVLPVTAGGLLTKLSSSYEMADKASAAREKAAKAYASSADEVLAQIHTDCVWNTRFTTADSGSEKFWNQADKLSQKPEPGYYCPTKEGCVPGTAANLDKFVELILKANKMDHETVMKSFAQGKCEATSLGKLCGPLKKNWVEFWRDEVNYAETARKGGDIESVISKNDKRVEDRTEAFRNALIKAHPELKKDKRLAKKFDGTSNYFDALTRAALVRLEKLSDAIPTGNSTDSEQRLALS